MLGNTKEICDHKQNTHWINLTVYCDVDARSRLVLAENNAKLSDQGISFPLPSFFFPHGDV